MASVATQKPLSSESKPEAAEQQKSGPAAALEEDDEFEDFPVDGIHLLPFLLSFLQATFH